MFSNETPEGLMSFYKRTKRSMHWADDMEANCCKAIKAVGLLIDIVPAALRLIFDVDASAAEVLLVSPSKISGEYVVNISELLEPSSVSKTFALSILVKEILGCWLGRLKLYLTVAVLVVGGLSTLKNIAYFQDF
ncbi:hypothetical protein GQX74_013557 [Glossina fuscipes]|nr:hypothetical protein GQX74_013557 [Glossina fuscipes]